MKKMSKILVAGCSVMLASSVAACSSSNDSSSGATAAKSVKIVYIPGGMPYFGVKKNGNLTGVDGALVDKAAKNVGFKPTTQSSDFAAFLAGIQGGRYDMGVGGVAWTKERAATGLFTDPVYYSPVVVMCKQGTKPSTTDQLKGLSVGAITATIQDTGIRAIGGVDAHTYPTPQNAIQDLIAGRLDCISLDVLIVAYTHRQRPDLKDFDITTIQAPTDAQVKANPKLASFQPYMVAWYLSKSNTKLVDTLNTEIRAWYKSGFTADVLTKWGVNDPKSLLTPIASFDTARRGVDRPADWTAPSAGE